MKISKDVILTRIDELLANSSMILSKAVNHERLVDKTTFGTIALIKTLYGINEEFSNAIIEVSKSYKRNSIDVETLQLCIEGILETIKFEVENGFITKLENQVAGEIYGDFISISKMLIKDGHKDAAAVLACGALEDSLKHYALKKGLDVYDEDLSKVISALKSKGLIRGVQAGVVQSYVKLRNNAFHAQFDKIELPEVSSLISFVEQFLLNHYLQ